VLIIFWIKLSHWQKKNYVPENDDILRARHRTTGIIETELEKNGSIICIIDVGGQRSERKKWMMCFQGVTAMIFCIALSGYDLKLAEDNETNRIHEDITLFGEIVNSKWFSETPVIIFFNKYDLFEEKIKIVPLTVAFPKYEGTQDFDECIAYITERCTEKIKNPEKDVYRHVTCATDTSNIEAVWEGVYDIILNSNLKEAGLGL